MQRAYAKIDTLAAQGPDTWGLTRDEMAAIHLYTDDGLGGAAGCLFRPLNAALRAQGRADAKPYWGYIRLLQHLLPRGSHPPHEPGDQAWCGDYS